MRKFRLSKRKFKKIIEYFLLFTLSFTFSFLFIIRKNDLFLNKSFYFVSKFKFEENSEYLDKLRNAVEFSFKNYIENCPQSDEINTETGNCINNTGFSATLLESVETLYILGLKKLYNKAYNIIKSNFNCKNLGRVNKRNLWTRGIGSLIGSYVLTKDKMFLNKADECATEILTYRRSNNQFVDIKNKKSSKRKIENGSQFSDFSVGLPELYSLYLYTRNEKYLNIVKNKLKSKENLNTDDFYFDSKNVDGLSDFALLSNISNKKLTISLIENIENFVSLDPDCIFQYEMLNVEDLTKKKLMNSDKLFSKGKDAYFQPFTSFSPGKNSQIIPFMFDATFLKVLYNRGYKEKLKTIIAASLQNCRGKFGYSGLIKTTKNNIKHTNVQPSSFFGEWTKIGVLSSVLSNEFKNAVLNSRGHFLLL